METELESQENNQINIRTALKYLLPYFWPKDNKIRLQVTAAFIFSLFIIALYTFTPFVFRKIITELEIKPINQISFIYILLLGYGFLWTFSQISSILRATAIIRPLENGARLFSLKLFDHLQSLSMRFHSERKTGAIANSISRAQYGFDSFFWNLFLFLAPTIIELFLAIAILGYYYGRLYVITLSIAMLGYILFSLIAMRWSIKAQNKYNEIDKQASSRLIDSLLNAETVKYFNNETYEHQQANELLRKREKAAIKRDMLSYLIRAGQWSAAGIGITLLTFISGKSVLTGKLTVGDFVLINTYLLQFTLPLVQFGNVLADTRKSLTNINNAIELLKKEPDIVDLPDAVPLKAKTAEIKFDHVSFSYNKDRQILKNISFTVLPGQTIAFVGPTGSGKSTISKLLFRLYDVQDGSVSINNQDIRTVTQDSLRSIMGVVSQDVILFNNTILYNIKYGHPTATEQEVEHAVKMANLDMLIKRLPDGYNTLVGERGTKLSGGERQRIGIARVILKKPVIYIFDEATSALDTATEKEIQKNLEDISTGSTTLVIAHRLSTIINANKIIVLKNGHIIEQGTHHELLELDGEYKNLWLKQVETDVEQVVQELEA